MHKFLGKLFGRQRSPSETGWPLSSPLLKLSHNDAAWTLANAVEGVLDLGATGSGKTSGSGRALALAYLNAGFGGLVLTAKREERQLWEGYCKETGRLDDLVCFGPNFPSRFNFLAAEVRHQGSGAGLTDNTLALLSDVQEIAERGTAEGGGREDAGYWRQATRQASRNAIDAVVLATGSVSVPDLHELVTSAPTAIAEKDNAEWQKKSFCWQCIAAADKAVRDQGQREDLHVVAKYWLWEYPKLADKTRSIILSGITSMVDLLNRGMLKQQFCKETNLTPEDTHDGKVILVDMPVHELREVGLIAQGIWKHAWQRAAERRDVRANPRPIFLWADEAHYFLTHFDQAFQTTCRSARVATVLLSQNISNFYAALGGNEKARVLADSLFANLNTKILHANSDFVTNQWASEMIGKSRQLFMSGGQSHSPDEQGLPFLFGMDGPHQSNSSFSEQYEFEIQPTVFTQLRTGGVKYKGLVDAIVFQNGTRFESTGRTWLPTTFRQKF